MIRFLAGLGDSLLGASLRLPLKLIPHGQVVSVKSGLNKNARWVVGSSVHGCWLGTYELAKQHLVSKLVRPGMVIWDVGANAGFYTLAFSRMVGSSGSVYAFEPYAENVCHLQEHIRLNNRHNVTVVQAALGASTGMVGFRTASSNSMGRISPEKSSYLVASMTGDDFLLHHPDARPDLIKLDVEGAESDCLLGISELLRKSSPQILLALHGSEQAHRSTAMLTALGYSLFHLDCTPATERPLNSDEIHARRVSAEPSRQAATDRPMGR
ncbi:MAG TPA: FkbM family methyltransferase [Gemmatimonadota bacterium]|nr:FkbM family methyltransferase [Gemmatimonadota bacterium]